MTLSGDMNVLYRFTAALLPLLIGGIAQAKTPDSLYTAAQAQAGAVLYTQNCAMCHDEAAPGKTLVRPGTSPTIGGIFAIMTTNMPLNQPGQLSHAQYEAIMAYALQQNGYPAGDNALHYAQTLSNTQPFVNKKP